MPIAFDTDLGAADFGNTPLTTTYTTTAAAALAARVVLFISHFSTSALVTSASVGGNALTMDKRTTNGSDFFDIWSAHIAGGVLSGATVSVTRAVSGGVGGILIGAASWTGVDSSGSPVDTTGSATSTGTAWSSGAATNSLADALFVGGSGNEDPTAATSSTATAGTEIHDRYRTTDQQGITTGYTIAASVASRNIGGNWSNANSTANTGGLVIYKAAAGAVAAVLSPTFNPLPFMR